MSPFNTRSIFIMSDIENLYPLIGCYFVTSTKFHKSKNNGTSGLCSISDKARQGNSRKKWQE